MKSTKLILTSMKQSLALLLLDKGFVIGIQLVTLLIMRYVLPTLSTSLSKSSFAGISILVFLIQILTNSAIIIRLYGLTQGYRASIPSCYRKAFSRTPILLFAMLGCTVVLLPSFAIIGIVISSIVNHLSLTSLLPFVEISLLMSLLIGFIYLTYFLGILVIAKDKSALEAISENFQLMKSYMKPSILIFAGIIYVSPFFLLASFKFADKSIFIAFILQLWTVMWHSLCVVLFECFSKGNSNRNQILTI